MGKKVNELKKAIQNLKVSEALRTPAGVATKDFAFKAPGSEIEASSDETNPRSIQSEMKVKSQIQISSDQMNPSPIPAQIEATSEIEKIRDENNQSSIQSQSKGFDVTPFVPKEFGTFDFIEMGDGVFQIPHKIYEFTHRVIHTKVELLVFNCLLRNTLGFRRSSCKASQSYIARWTGIAAPNVRRALKSLREQLLIIRLEEGTISHESAVYELPIVTTYLKYLQDQKASVEGPHGGGIKSNSDGNNLSSNRSQNSDQINPRSQINLIPKKERLNKEENKSPSQTELSSKTIKDYFSANLPEKRREKDFLKFLDLRKNASEEQIGKALEYVLSDGMVGTNAKPYSPWDYLTHALPEVLQHVIQKENIIASKQKKASDAEEKARARQEQDLRDEEEYRQKERAFHDAFPKSEQQLETILEFCRQSKIPLNPDSKIARSITIQNW